MSSRPRPFEAFFAEQYESVCRGLSVAFRDPLLAEEAAQEAFMRALVRWDHVKDMERPAGWVYVVAVRFALRRRRRTGGEMPVSTSVMPSVEDLVVDRVSLEHAIDELPERQRVALVLRYYSDLPLDEIAAAMGCALGTVKSTLHAAQTRLHIELDDELPEVERDAP